MNDHPLIVAYEKAAREADFASPARIDYEVRQKAFAEARGALVSALLAHPAPVQSGNPTFLGHLIRYKAGKPAEFVPAGKPIPLRDGSGSVTAIFDGPQSVTAQSSPSPEPVQKIHEGIYVASRASAVARPAMWRSLRAAGAPIISTWIDEAGEGETADISELWARILREVTTAERLVFYAEPDDFPLKGAYVEAGMALAAGVPVMVYTPGVEAAPHTCHPVGSWMTHPFVRVAYSFDDAFYGATAAINHAGGGKNPGEWLRPREVRAVRRLIERHRHDDPHDQMTLSALLLRLMHSPMDDAATRPNPEAAA